jgi:hypothetical protein
MSDNARNTHNDVRFAPVGMGMSITWQCFGCGKQRMTLGSKGVGVFKRCGVCVAARAERQKAG